MGRWPSVDHLELATAASSCCLPAAASPLLPLGLGSLEGAPAAGNRFSVTTSARSTTMFPWLLCEACGADSNDQSRGVSCAGCGGGIGPRRTDWLSLLFHVPPLLLDVPIRELYSGFAAGWLLPLLLRSTEPPASSEWVEFWGVDIR